MDPEDHGKRKMVEEQHRRGRGRTTTPCGCGDKGAREQYNEDQEHPEMEGFTIDHIPNTPHHISEFNHSYIRDFEGEI
jgi:hypothetical protein